MGSTAVELSRPGRGRPPEIWNVKKREDYTNEFFRNTNYKPEYADNLVDWMEKRCEDRVKVLTVQVESIGRIEDLGDPNAHLKRGQAKSISRAVSKSVPQISEWCWSTFRSTIIVAQQWAQQYPDFQTAYARARTLQQQFVLDGITDGLIHPSVGSFIMKNMFRSNAAGGVPLADGAGGWADQVEVLQAKLPEPNMSGMLSAASPAQLELIERLASECAAAGVRIKIIGIDQTSAAHSL